LAENLSKLEKESSIAAFSKWAWFANELYAAMSEIPVDSRRALGLDVEAIPKAVFSIPGEAQSSEQKPADQATSLSVP
jgi:hypothetical protein